ncbi:hypothetical protein L1889_10690 [Paenalcaligenes niemegkensis]|uniref:hypothetical protein n=1 Tax=Paenalcaligenes niemegkensis TaxID=2895469 RepID=UPI001EE84F45|nr:hypothetical protein [Paenalcaligenes niemegkensis]MCQ9617107.1 hypothetical protein [Paenalcaligenes niemegkensis]
MDASRWHIDNSAQEGVYGRTANSLSFKTYCCTTGSGRRDRGLAPLVFATPLCMGGIPGRSGADFWALLAEPWWDSVAFWILGLFFTVGAVESVYLCLRKDSGFNQKYNAHSSGRSRTGIATVLLAIAATLGGASISMAWLAHVVFRSFHYLGWLEGLNY